jgi:hypothetical protein
MMLSPAEEMEMGRTPKKVPRWYPLYGLTGSATGALAILIVSHGRLVIALFFGGAFALTSMTVNLWLLATGRVRSGDD